MANVKKNKKSSKNNSYPNRKQSDHEDQNLDRIQFQEVHDKHYKALLNSHGSKKIKTNHYFQQDIKYKGNTQPIQQTQNHQQSLSQDQDINDDIKKAFANLKKSKKQSNNLMKEEIHQIDEDDQNFFQQLERQHKQSNETQHLKNQLQLFKKLVKVRYYSQNQVQQIKKFPYSHFPQSSTLNSLQKNLQTSLLRNLQSLLSSTQQLANLVTGPIEDNIHLKQAIGYYNDNQQQYKGKRVNLQKIFCNYEQMMKSAQESLQKQLIKWSQKTTLLSNPNSNTHYGSIIMQTPIGQTQKVMNNWEKASAKSQLKRGIFKVIFEGEQNVRYSTDKQIFDDHQLFIQLEKQYENAVQQNENQFLANDTLKFLKNRHNRVSTKKQVDRKASKNRKLRFATHPKLLNFMSCEPGNLLQARDQIVKNILNSGNDNNHEIDYIDM